MITIDIDAKIEEIHVSPSKSGMSATFELLDAVNPEIKLFITFYKKQVDYMMKKFYEVDRDKLREELRLEFLEREDRLRAEIRQEIERELAEIKKRMKPRGVADA